MLISILYTYFKGVVRANCTQPGCKWQADSRDYGDNVPALALQHHYSHLR